MFLLSDWFGILLLRRTDSYTDLFSIKFGRMPDRQNSKSKVLVKRRKRFIVIVYRVIVTYLKAKDKEYIMHNIHFDILVECANHHSLRTQNN